MTRTYSWTDLTHSERGVGSGQGTGWARETVFVVAAGLTLERVIARAACDSNSGTAGYVSLPTFATGRIHHSVLVEAHGVGNLIYDHTSPVVPYVAGLSNGISDNRFTYFATQAWSLDTDQRIRRLGTDDVVDRTAVTLLLEYQPEPINGATAYFGWNYHWEILLLTSQSA